MKVTVLKPNPENPKGQIVATYHNVDEIRTVYDINGELCFLLFLNDESFDLSPWFPLQDYNLLVE